MIPTRRFLFLLALPFPFCLLGLLYPSGFALGGALLFILFSLFFLDRLLAAGSSSIEIKRELQNSLFLGINFEVNLYIKPPENYLFKKGFNIHINEGLFHYLEKKIFRKDRDEPPEIYGRRRRV